MLLLVAALLWRYCIALSSMYLLLDRPPQNCVEIRSAIIIGLNGANQPTKILQATKDGFVTRVICSHRVAAGRKIMKQRSNDHGDQRSARTSNRTSVRSQKSQSSRMRKCSEFGGSTELDDWLQQVSVGSREVFQMVEC